MCMRMASGFSLVELMITLAIAVILLAVAVPSYQSLILDGRQNAIANELVLALTYAKSEAVKRGIVRVTVCSRATNTTCSDTTTWDNGWLVFVDNNANGTVDGADLVLQVYPALPGGSTLRAAARPRVTFRSTGSSAGFNDTLRLCDTRGTAKARGIVLSAQGRVKIDTLASVDASASSP